MKTISPALLAHLQGDVRTIATLFTITRKDSQVFCFTDLDVNIVFNGLTYESAGGYTHSSIDAGSTLSTGNLEINAIFDSSSITQESLESGVWDFAAVTIQLVNYKDLTMGAVQLNGGYLGAVTILNGRYTVELRGLGQVMQQDAGDMYSPTCRATFGDSKCTLDLTPFTFSGSIQSLINATSWNDSTLTQVGPTVPFIDSRGSLIPTRTPFTIKVVPPTGGAYVSDDGVKTNSGASMTKVGGAPNSGEYASASDGTYTFNSADSVNIGNVFIDYEYSIGYFAYGFVKWLTGNNAGSVAEVKSFSPGVVTLAMQNANPMQVGDTYTITAGCDKQPGTCGTGRFNNLIHFRGEPFIPGQDTMLSPKS